jgi:hypothetical protein
MAPAVSGHPVLMFNSVRNVVSGVASKLTGGADSRKGSGKKASKTRKRAASKRSAAAKRGAQTRKAAALKRSNNARRAAKAGAAKRSRARSRAESMLDAVRRD